jgi:uncharacterized membrane protein
MSARLVAVDALRGGALIAMIVYHLAWDLSFLGLVEVDIAAEPGWSVFARLVAASFLILVGVSLELARRGGASWRRRLRRIALIALAAAAVSLATHIALPGQGVSFGILHCIALSSLIAGALHRLPSWLLALGAAAAWLAPGMLASPMFNAPAWLWLGLSTEVPPAPDYVPLLPWFAAVLAGMLIGRRLPDHPADRLPPMLGPLAAMGRRSLAIYLLHQPVLLGLIFAWLWLSPPGPADSLRAACEAAGADKLACEAYRACMLRELGGGPTPLLGPAARRVEAEDGPLWDAAAANCRAKAGIGESPAPRPPPGG